MGTTIYQFSFFFVISFSSTYILFLSSKRITISIESSCSLFFLYNPFILSLSLCSICRTLRLFYPSFRVFFSFSFSFTGRTFGGLRYTKGNSAHVRCILLGFLFCSYVRQWGCGILERPAVCWFSKVA